MYSVYTTGTTGAVKGRHYYNLAPAIRELKRCYERHIAAVMKGPEGKVIGRVECVCGLWDYQYMDGDGVFAFGGELPHE